MKETPRRRITVTSSSNEISSDRLGKRVLVRERGVTPFSPTHFYSRFIWTKRRRRSEQFFLL
jgi:hypothetical protein